MKFAQEKNKGKSNAIFAIHVIISIATTNAFFITSKNLHLNEFYVMEKRVAYDA